MTTKTPKKHKQRFEHFSWRVDSRYKTTEIIKSAEKSGFELINIISTLRKTTLLGNEYDWDLFFKRPV